MSNRELSRLLIRYIRMKIPVNFVEGFAWSEISGMYAYLVARGIAANNGGYFTLEQLRNKGCCSEPTLFRWLRIARGRCLVRKVSKGKYLVSSIRKIPASRARGHYELPDSALDSLDDFKAALAGLHCSFIIAKQRRAYDKHFKLTPEKRALALNRRLNGKDGKSGPPLTTRAAMQCWEQNEYKVLPENISRICYQYLDPERKNEGFVALKTLSDRLGCSMATASRLRWKAHKKRYIHTELRQIEISKDEAMFAPYLEKSRVFEKDGKYYYRMTSKVTANLSVNFSRSHCTSLYPISSSPSCLG